MMCNYVTFSIEHMAEKYTCSSRICTDLTSYYRWFRYILFTEQTRIAHVFFQS